MSWRSLKRAVSVLRVLDDAMLVRDPWSGGVSDVRRGMEVSMVICLACRGLGF